MYNALTSPSMPRLYLCHMFCISLELQEVIFPREGGGQLRVKHRPKSVTPSRGGDRRGRGFVYQLGLKKRRTRKREKEFFIKRE